MTITEWQSQVDSWIKTYGVRYFSELTNMTILTEEVGELARHISRKYGEQSYKMPISNEEIKKKIADEIADIIFVTTCLANQMEIDIAKALEENIYKKTSRDKDRHQSNEKL
jgi:NTP pyrophosphatase (non-canonical NTP hydrolase)